MSDYSEGDRGTGWSWFKDAVMLWLAVLGTIFSDFVRGIKSTPPLEEEE